MPESLHKRPAFFAIAVTAFALIDIWLLAPHWPAGAWLLGTAVALFLLCRTRPPGNLGLGWPPLFAALRAWGWAYILCSCTLVFLVEWRSLTVGPLAGGLAYLIECVIQQLIFQHLVCAPLAQDFGPSQKSDWTAGALFSIVHMPNPVLVPATLVWGAAASRLFRHHRSLWAVAILQYLLSAILYALLPRAWHHAFRIGPHYFTR